METFKVYGKFIAALLAAFAVGIQSALSDGAVSTDEWIQLAIQITTAAGVWLTANLPGYTWAKTATAAILAGLNATVAALSDGISMSEWVNIGIAIAGVILVQFTPSRTTAPVEGPANP